MCKRQSKALGMSYKEILTRIYSDKNKWAKADFVKLKNIISLFPKTRLS